MMKGWPAIIEETAKTPLGIVALMGLILGAIGCSYFRASDFSEHRGGRMWRFAAGYVLTLGIQALVFDVLAIVEPSGGIFGNLGPGIQYMFVGQWVGYAIAFALLIRLGREESEAVVTCLTVLALVCAAFYVRVWVATYE